jgi:hypothetical protein
MNTGPLVAVCAVMALACTRVRPEPPADFMDKQVYAHAVVAGLEDPGISIRQILEFNATSPATSSAQWTQIDQSTWKLLAKGTDRVSRKSVETIMQFSAPGSRPPRANSVELRRLVINGVELPDEVRANMVKRLGENAKK